MGRTESEKHLSVIDNKIDKEIANLLATYERYRNDIMKYSAGELEMVLWHNHNSSSHLQFSN